jgi:hypothetical protein
MGQMRACYAIANEALPFHSMACLPVFIFNRLMTSYTWTKSQKPVFQLKRKEFRVNETLETKEGISLFSTCY